MSSTASQPSAERDHRRMRRRTWGVVAGLAAIATLAAGCGGSDEPAAPGNPKDPGASVDASLCPVDALDKADGPVDITVWHAWVGKTADTIEKTADEYNKSQNKVKVHVESQGTYEEMLKKYTDAMAKPETLPDLVLNVDTALQFMIDSQTAVPAAACIAADPSAKSTYDDILPAVTSAYTVKGTLWPAAFSVSEPVLYVNEDHFKAAGLSTDKLPTNLEELTAASKQIMKAKNAGVPELKGVKEPMVLRLDSWYLEHWMTGNETEIVNNDNGRSALATKSLMTSPDVTTTFDWFRSMTDEGLLNPIPYSKPYDQLFAMALGGSSMLIDTSTAITTVDAAIAGTINPEDIGLAGNLDLSGLPIGTLKIGVGLNPGLKDAGRGQVGGAAWYIVDRGAPESIAATWDFVKFSNEAPQQVKWTLDGSYLPIREAVRQDPAIEKDFTSTRRGKWLAIAADGLNELDADHPGPVIGPYNEFRSTYRKALEKVTLDKADVASTITSANDEFQKSLDLYKAEVGG